ncbi:MAG: sigma-70 family RNA polymerase sigma factor [Solirubrobacterales bacterium]|nr:sigma-70 family RNA polymerase sigma factor [Solirubrobacterales bacterium]
MSIGAPLLRLRSDEQLVALFRAGHDEAFRTIHDRYRQRLFAYARQMLPGSRHDAEDALQDVFVRAYSGLRADDRELALRAWLYRIAHNRCVDELRRPAPAAPELIEFVRAPTHDPIAEAEQRESLRRLIEDVRRLPEQQRSALLMRELSGMSYGELAAALDVSVPAIKSLLVRARVGLTQAAEARETACAQIQDELVLAHDRRVRPNAMARRHLRDCAGCRQFRSEMRGVSRRFAALVPALGPAGVAAKVLGIGSAGGSAAASGSAAAAGTGGVFAASGLFAGGIGHVATLLAAAIITAGGAIEIRDNLVSPSKHPVVRHHASIFRQHGATSSTSLSRAVPPVAPARPKPPSPPLHAAVTPASPPPPAPVSVVHHAAEAVAPPARQFSPLHKADSNRASAAIADGALSAAAAAAGGMTLPPSGDSQSSDPGSSSSSSSSSASADKTPSSDHITSPQTGTASARTPSGGESSTGGTSPGAPGTPASSPAAGSTNPQAPASSGLGTAAGASAPAGSSSLSH